MKISFTYFSWSGDFALYLDFHFCINMILPDNELVWLEV